jgi:hypothetical protein
MGGEWALGVALVMELWPGASRAALAGWIGAFGNLGYCVLGLVALGLNRVGADIHTWLANLGFAPGAADYLTRNGNWRLLMLVGALPALLTLFLRLMVPESQRWLAEKKTGKTQHWSSKDLLLVLLGACLGAMVLTCWVIELPLWARAAITALLLPGVLVCYIFPAWNFLRHSALSRPLQKRTLGRMLLAAGLSGVPLLATWGGVMWVYNWVAELAPTNADARPLTQVSSAFGAAVGCLGAAYLGGRIGRRPSYALLCVSSAITLYCFYRFNTQFDWLFLLSAGGVGLITASFYGWLPLYLPELFPTMLRATGQGFGFNFGRVMASIGSLQTGVLLAAFNNDYATACSLAAVVYIVGLLLIMLAPETHGQPLPD